MLLNKYVAKWEMKECPDDLDQSWYICNVECIQEESIAVCESLHIPGGKHEHDVWLSNLADEFVLAKKYK